MTTALTERRELAHRTTDGIDVTLVLEPAFKPGHDRSSGLALRRGPRVRSRRRRRARCLQPPLRVRRYRQRTPHRYAARGDEPLSVATDP